MTAEAKKTSYDARAGAPIAADLRAHFQSIAANDTLSTLLGNLRNVKAWIMADALATSIRLSPQARLRTHLERQQRPYSDPLAQIVALADAVALAREHLIDGATPEATVVTLVEGTGVAVETGMRHGYMLLTGEEPPERPIDPVTLDDWGVQVVFDLEAISGPDGFYRSKATVSSLH